MKTAIDGTENQMVRRASFMNRPGLIRVFSEGQQTQAPFAQATNISATDKSNVMSKVCEKRSCSVIEKRLVMKAIYGSTFRWATMTPLGTPVLPEVKSR